MLAVYRNSLLMRTPTPLRERLGRLAPAGARRRQALAGASPGSPQAGGLPLQSQYDLSDSFIAPGGRCGFVANSACPLLPSHAGTTPTGRSFALLTLVLPFAHRVQMALLLMCKICYVLAISAQSSLRELGGLSQRTMQAGNDKQCKLLQRARRPASTRRRSTTTSATCAEEKESCCAAMDAQQPFT